MAEAKTLPDEPDLDPLQSQRKILSGLLARFTADRDLLISTVQACEERLQVLASRLEAVPVAEPATNGSGPDALKEVRASLTQLEQAQRQASKVADDCRAISAQALARADQALNRSDELVRNDKLEALGIAIGACTERIEALSGRVEASRVAGEQLTARAEAAIQRCEQLAQAPREPKSKQLQVLAKAIDRLAADLDRIKADAARPQEILAKLVSRVAALESHLVDLRGASAGTTRDDAMVAPPAATRMAPAAAPSARLWPLSFAVGAGVLLTVLAFLMLFRPEEPPLTTTVARTDAGQQPQQKIAMPAKPAAPEPAKPSAPEPAEQAAREPAAAAPQVPAAEPATALSVETHLASKPVAAAAPAAVAKTSEGASGEQTTTTAANAEPEPQSPPGPARLVSLQPDGAMSFVLQPKEKKACIYHSTGGAIVADQCFPILAARVQAWAPWLVARDLNAQRIRLVDDSGHKRLRIVPENHPLWTDTVRLPQSAFTALSEKVKPWGTVWLAIEGAEPAPTAQDAASLRQAVEGWRQAWEQSRFDDYAGFYSASFVPSSGGDASRWWDYKRSLFERSGSISVQLGATTMATGDTPEDAIVSFDQLYHSSLLTSRCFKVLHWRHESEGWKIRSETVLSERPAT